MDTYPGPTSCARNCAGLVAPGAEQAHYAWHDQNDATIAALRAQVGIKV